MVDCSSCCCCCMRSAHAMGSMTMLQLRVALGLRASLRCARRRSANARSTLAAALLVLGFTRLCTQRRARSSTDVAVGDTAGAGRRAARGAPAPTTLTSPEPDTLTSPPPTAHKRPAAATVHNTQRAWKLSEARHTAVELRGEEVRGLTGCVERGCRWTRGEGDSSRCVAGRAAPPHRGRPPTCDSATHPRSSRRRGRKGRELGRGEDERSAEDDCLPCRGDEDSGGVVMRGCEDALCSACST